MGEFLIGLFVILIILGALYERDELELKVKKLEQEAKQEREAIKLEKMAIEIERNRLRQLDEKLKHDKQLLKLKLAEQNSREYLTSSQIVKSLTFIAVLAICIVLFFKMIYSS